MVVVLGYKKQITLICTAIQNIKWPNNQYTVDASIISSNETSLYNGSNEKTPTI